MHTNPIELVEKQILTTRFYRDRTSMCVSMAGVAYEKSPGRTFCILNPNDANVSLPFSTRITPEVQLIAYHCFAGMFASRIYRYLDRPWEIFRLHINLDPYGQELSADFGELLVERESRGQVARVFIEHFGPQLVPHDLLIARAESEQIENLMEPCPVRLTPRREIYMLDAAPLPHPDLSPVGEHLLVSHMKAARETKKVLVQ